VCNEAGDADDWIHKLDNSIDVRPKNRHRRIAEIYLDSLDDFTDNFYIVQDMMTRLGYTSPVVPPGKAFSLMSYEQFMGIVPAEFNSNLARQESYIAIPIYKHVGMLDDIMLYDGCKYERLFRVQNRNHCDAFGFCGNLPYASVEELFVAPSINDMISIMGKQRSEGVPDTEFHVVVDLAEKRRKRESDTFKHGRIRSDRIFFLRPRGLRTSQLWELPEEGATSELYIIDDYTKHSVAVLSANAASIGRRTEPCDTVYLKRAIQESKQPYRFFVDGCHVKAHRMLLGSKKKNDKAVAVISGLLDVRRDTDGSYTLRTKYYDKPTKEYKGVTEEIFQDYETFNSFLTENKSDDRRDKPVVLLDWFEDKAILPYLILISDKTTKVLNKGGSRC